MYTALAGNGHHQYTVGMLYRPKSEPFYYPDGNKIETGGRRISLNQSGLYLEGEDQTPLAVNLDYSDSRFEPLQTIEDPFITFCDQTWKESIFQSRYGFELWKYLILAVLILFALEMIIVKSEDKNA